MSSVDLPPLEQDHAAHDTHRVSVLRAYGILDTSEDERFDAIVRLAARLCDAPVAVIGLIDADRLWFKARVGGEVGEVPRAEAFCDHLLRSGEDVLVVPDLAADERFASNPSVTERGSRFYAGTVLRTPGGVALGALAVLDVVPRELTRAQRDALRSLARQVESLLAEHRPATPPPGPLASRAALLQAMAASGIATALLDEGGRYAWWSDECAERLGWTSADVLGRDPIDFLFAGTDDVAATEPDLRLSVDHRWHGCLRITRADGSTVATQAFVVALRDADGRVEGYLTGMVDPELAPPSSQVGLVESVLVRSEDAVLLCDGRLQGEGPTIVYANPAACALAGLRLVELAGRPASELIFNGADPVGLAEVVGVLRTGRSVRRELVVESASGPLATEVELTPFGDVSGDVAQVVIVVHDISARREAEAQAAATEARLRLAAELAGVGAWEIDLPSGRIVWDDRVRELLDLAPGTPPTIEAWYAAITPEDEVAGRLRLASLSGQTDAVEAAYRLPLADGSERRLLARGRVIERDEDAATTRIIGVLLDVTESHAATDRIVSTLESIAEGYYAIDRDWCFTYVNRCGEELLGRSRHELLGRNAKLEYPDAVGTVIEEQYERAMAGESVEFEVFFAPHDRWYEVRAYPLADGIAVHYRDINARVAQQSEREALLAAERAARTELAHAATHDPLTGLPNRVELLSWLTDALASPRRAGDVAVLFCDVDRFKVVNDSLGHAAGDELLVAVAQRLAHDIRPGDMVARLGGDEFVVALPSASPGEAERVAARLLDSFREPVVVAGRRLVVSASIGIALADRGATAETLLRDADAALYLAKDAGRDQVARFDDEVRTGVVTRLQTEHELRDAVDAGQLRLHYQPAFDLRTGEVTSAEALLRWQHPTRGLLTAGAFVELAEDTGLVGALGDWVVPEACGAHSLWTGALDDLPVWVNVSLRQLVRPGFAAHFLGLIRAGGGRPERIGVEVTESALAEGNSVPLRELRLLSDAGIQIALDDFGTGYSSIARLRRYPVDVLKLDRAFVADVHDEAGRSVVAAVVDLAHAVDAIALAEGVETAEQLEIVRSLGCDRASGWHLAREVPAEDLAAAVAAAPI
jgi:diguanylate cyclase (GGDEF)-like protein/PAS domain S-box-containing protein